MNTPQITRAGGRWFAVYELHMTNFFTMPVTIGEVSVLAAGRSSGTLKRYSGKVLSGNLKTIGPASDTVPRYRIDAGRRAVLFAWIPVGSPAAAPDSIIHRVSTTIAATKDSQIVIGGRARVSRQRPTVIDAPVRGTGWISYYGACPDGVPAHNQLSYPRAGLIRFPQRFAVDWIKLGSDGRVLHGDSSRNDSYYAYRQPVYAVADGTVMLTIEDVKDNVPPDLPAPITRHTVAGNVIVLAIGGGRYAVYGHIRPGSIKVTKGSRVKRGQQIAEVGNTGNSTGPHLHFHIVDAPSVGAGEGMSFMYRHYDLVSDEPISDAIIDEGKVWRPGPWASSPRALDLPTCGSVVSFLNPK
jgi:hypothetical protein